MRYENEQNAEEKEEVEKKSHSSPGLVTFGELKKDDDGNKDVSFAFGLIELTSASSVLHNWRVDISDWI